VLGFIGNSRLESSKTTKALSNVYCSALKSKQHLEAVCASGNSV